MKRVYSRCFPRACSFVLSMVLFAAALIPLPFAAKAEALPAKLHIGMVFAGAVSEKGKAASGIPVSNSFVEIYNPNDFEVSLDGYTLHYQGFPTQAAAERPETQWDSLALDKTKKIPARCSYLIDCGEADTTGSANAVTLTGFDQVWTPSPLFCTKGGKYVLTYGVNSIPAKLVDPHTGGANGTPISGYIDMFGVAGNDVGATDQIDGCEGSYLRESSKQKGFVRKNRNTDTDDNAKDFVAVDFREAGCELPRSLADGRYVYTGPASLVFEQDYAVVGSPLSVRVEGSEETFRYAWSVGGSTVGDSSDTYTPKAEDLEKFIAVTATSSAGSEVYEAQMYFSTLPVVYVNTEGGKEITSKTEYMGAQMHIQGNDEFNWQTTTLYDGATQIRGRGNYTWVQPKKPYRLKLESKTSVFGMSLSKHFVMLADYGVRNLLHNIVGQDFADRNTDNYTCKFTSVVLVMNGGYQGVYQFGEQVRIDEGRVDIFDWEQQASDIAKTIGKAEGFSPEDITTLETVMTMNMAWITDKKVAFHGVTYDFANYGISYPDMTDPENLGGILMEIDIYEDEATMFRTPMNNLVKAKNPEYMLTNSTLLTNTQNFFNAFEACMKSDDATTVYNGKTVSYSDLFDMNSLVEYFFVDEFTTNTDALLNSVYWYKDIGEKAKFGPSWDLDWSFSVHVNDWSTKQLGWYNQNTVYYRDLLRDPYFLVRAWEHYKKIRQTVIAPMIAPGGFLDQAIEKLEVPGIANYARWYDDTSDPAGTYKAYAQNCKNFIHNRVAWLDTQLATLESFIASTGYYYKTSKLNVTAVDQTRTDGTVAVTAAVTEPAMVKAVFYVNGKKLEPVDVHNASATVLIPVENLVVGALNVVQVRGLQADGSFNRDVNGRARSAFDVFELDASLLTENMEKAIDALDDVTDQNYREVRQAVDTIQTMIEEYKTKFGGTEQDIRNYDLFTQTLTLVECYETVDDINGRLAGLMDPGEIDKSNWRTAKSAVDSVERAVDALRQAIDSLPKEIADAHRGPILELLASTDALVTSKRVIAVLEKGLVFGDLNEDGAVQAADALIVLQYSVELLDLTEDQNLTADTDLSGDITTLDALRILQYVVSLVDKLPQIS